MNKKITVEIIIVGILVSLLNKLALAWSLYWTTDWFDIIMHFLGGFLIAMIALLIISRLNLIAPKVAQNFILIVGGALFIGISWELFELFTGMTNVYLDKLDTALDLVMDTIGAVSAFYYSKNKYLKNNIS